MFFLLFLSMGLPPCLPLGLDFSIQHDDPALGQGVIDLVPGGRDIAVTNENKIRYYNRRQLLFILVFY